MTNLERGAGYWGVDVELLNGNLMEAAVVIVRIDADGTDGNYKILYCGAPDRRNDRWDELSEGHRGY